MKKTTKSGKFAISDSLKRFLQKDYFITFTEHTSTTLAIRDNRLVLLNDDEEVSQVIDSQDKLQDVARMIVNEHRRLYLSGNMHPDDQDQLTTILTILGERAFTATTRRKVCLQSMGKTANDYIVEFKQKGIHISQATETVILTGFENHPKGTVFEVEIIGFESEDGIALQIIERDLERKRFSESPLEVALLLREKLSDSNIKKLGFKSIEVLHRPVGVDIPAARIGGLLPQHLTLSDKEIGISGCHPSGKRFSDQGVVVLSPAMSAKEFEFALRCRNAF